MRAGAPDTGVRERSPFVGGPFPGGGLTAHADGYSSELVGKKMICKELACKGKGDPACVMEIMPDE
jgi:hypothetical protein